MVAQDAQAVVGPSLFVSINTAGALDLRQHGDVSADICLVRLSRLRRKGALRQ